MKYLLIFLSSFILITTNAWAADDAVIQDLQSDVTVTKGKADQNAADINTLKGGLPVLEDRVADLEDAVATLTNALVEANAKIATLTSDLATANFNISTLQDDLMTLAATVAGNVMRSS